MPKKYQILRHKQLFHMSLTEEEKVIVWRKVVTTRS